MLVDVTQLEASAALKPITALEIKWSDQYVSKPERLKGLIKFSNKNHLPVSWATTRSKIGETPLDGDRKIVHWPAAALAFDYGIHAVKGRLAGYEARIEGITNE